ncbi:MAG: hypothetical protein KZQ83_07490 [gamma proteobacterium symbiont of Taylorina sp.]|nr:hypothetical protein [gamma proteobacterium symbiont of Taylorina sp.]
MEAFRGMDAEDERAMDGLEASPLGLTTPHNPRILIQHHFRTPYFYAVSDAGVERG